MIKNSRMAILQAIYTKIGVTNLSDNQRLIGFYTIHLLLFF